MYIRLYDRLMTLLFFPFPELRLIVSRGKMSNGTNYSNDGRWEIESVIDYVTL